MMLGTLHSMAFKVVKPIPAIITKHGDGYLAEWEEAAEWGCGDSPSEARNDLMSTIKEVFGIWEGQSLGPDLQKKYDLMRQHVVRNLVAK